MSSSDVAVSPAQQCVIEDLLRVQQAIGEAIRAASMGQDTSFALRTAQIRLDLAQGKGAADEEASRGD